METAVISLLEARKASRAISEEVLDESAIESLKKAAQLSASCYNKQPWRFLFLDDEESLEKARDALAGGNSWARNAPLLIVGFSKPDLDCQIKDGRDYYLFDLGMATQLILLQATELDLIARPMAGFSPQLIRERFRIPDEYEVVIVIAVGREGSIDELDERLQEMSRAPRTRNDLSVNFFSNEFPGS